jgi:hypothetical protein
MAESRGSGSNVELNDTRSNQTSSPMYSHPEESNYMKKTTNNYKKKREEGIRSRAQEMGRFPRSGQWGNFCQSTAESRGSDSNVELNDTRINQTSSPMEN